MNNPDKEDKDYKKWRAFNPKCIFLLVHGLGAHSERWQAMADFFLQKEISSYAIDLSGLRRIRDYHSQILRLRKIIAKENPGKQIFLVGESLGALASFLFAAKNPKLFNGLIFMSPAFASHKTIKPLEALKMISPIIYNADTQVKLPFDSSMCTRDKDLRKKMDSDPREYRSVSVRLVLDIFLAQKSARAVLKKIKGSVLFLVAGEDMIVDSDASREIFAALGAKDKTLLEFPMMYHALSIDLDKEVVFEEILSWVENRIQ